MMFGDAAARSRFFEAGEQGDLKVPPGRWVEHASSTDLGIWGREEDLIQDCARIAALEVRGIYGADTHPPAEAVAATHAFREAYRVARATAELRLAGALRLSGLPEDHPLVTALAPSAIPSSEQVSGEDVAVNIAAELAAWTVTTRNAR
jgi:hypothetical protein